MPNKLPFTPPKKTRLYEDVAEQIKQAIYDGVLKPGDHLPSERELCGVFNVGRPTIREALRTLTVMGLLETNHGFKGSVVKENDITQYMESVREQLSWLIKTDKKTLKELWEVRKYIELGIAHLVANNARPDDFNKIDALILKMKLCGKDAKAYFTLAVEFHRQLALASGNKIFYLIWEMFHDILLKGYMPNLNELFPEGCEKLLEVNTEMLEAIKSRDTERIDKAMEAHASSENLFGKNPNGDV